MASHKLGFLQAPASCSVCLEAVSDASERSIAKLICGHHFHLDCIGSAFNAKGSMQCPNCRHIENGQWLYANGCRQREDSILEDIMNEEDYDVFAGVSELIFPRDLMHFGHLRWCPYQSSYAQLSLSLGDADLSPAVHADLVVDVLLGEHMGSIDSLQPCPFLQAQGPTLPRHMPVVEENARMQEIPLHPHHGAPRQQFSSPRGHWARQASTVVTPIGVVGGIAFQDRPRWPQSESQPTGNPFSSHPRNNGRGRVPTSTQLPAGRQSAHYPESQILPGPLNWDFVGTSAVHNAAREAEPRESAAFTQWRGEGASAFRQYPTEPEVQRWAPPPLSGLYGLHGLHGLHGSEISTQAGFRAPGMQFPNQFRGPFQSFQSFVAEPEVDTGSFQPSTSFDPPR